MPKRSSNSATKATKPKRVKKPDVNELAFAAVQQIQAIGEKLDGLLPDWEQRRQIMRQMGSIGGKKGGKRRLETMTPEARKAAAQTAAKARWDKKKTSQS